MKPDERDLLARLQEETRSAAANPSRRYTSAIEIADTLGMNHKRAEYILHKWVERGWCNYGVSVRQAWLTESGLDLK